MESRFVYFANPIESLSEEIPQSSIEDMITDHFSNSEAYYRDWKPQFDSMLIHLYIVQNKNVLDISDIMCRSVGLIVNNLIRLQIIPDRKSARGYQEYRASPLYQQAIERQKEINRRKRDRKIVNDSDEDSDGDIDVTKTHVYRMVKDIPKTDRQLRSRTKNNKVENISSFSPIIPTTQQGTQKKTRYQDVRRMKAYEELQEEYEELKDAYEELKSDYKRQEKLIEEYKRFKYQIASIYSIQASIRN